MTKPRLAKVRALFYVLQQLIKRGCAYFDTASFLNYWNKWSNWNKLINFGEIILRAIDMSEFLHSNGDYRTLLSYRLAQKISVVTEIFVERFLQRGSRTVDQMQQAARSCKQNIVEGSAAAITSKETEIKLTNVARASLCELQEDYEDYLAFRGLKPWPKEHPRIQRLRAYVRSDGFDGEYVELCRRLPAEEFCNLALTLIIQTEYLLDKMLVAQQRRFLENGGIREAMSAARRKYREREEDRNDWNNQNNLE